jgi:hypothetical protein
MRREHPPPPGTWLAPIGTRLTPSSRGVLSAAQTVYRPGTRCRSRSAPADLQRDGPIRDPPRSRFPTRRAHGLPTGDHRQSPSFVEPADLLRLGAGRPLTRVMELERNSRDRIEDLAREKSSRLRYPRSWPEKPITGSWNDIPYLNRPLLPLAVALPGMLTQVEAELAGKKLEAAERRRLGQRAGLIRGLLAPRRSPIPD